MRKVFTLAIAALLCTAAALAQPSYFETTVGGELAFRAQAANFALLGPATGTASRPTFRAITLADLPAVLGGAGLMNYRGAWSGSIAYAVNDVVTDSSVTYVCTAAHTNHEPPNGSYWAAMSAVGTYAVAGASGETTAAGINEYLIVLNTGNALTTDTHSLLPANSEMTGVSWYINTTITGTSVTGFSVGLAGGSATYFCAAGTSLTAGLSGVCSGQYTNGLWNAAVGNITITTAGGTASAGKVRVAVHYVTITPPTS
jgi:hypothetical protein